MSILEGCGYSEAFCNKSSSLIANAVTTSEQTLEPFQWGSMQPLFAIGWKLVCNPKTHTCLFVVYLFFFFFLLYLEKLEKNEDSSNAIPRGNKTIDDA